MATERDCKHNSGVICKHNECNNRCGWNPKEAKARQREIRTKGLTKREDGINRLTIKGKEDCGNAD